MVVHWIEEVPFELVGSVRMFSDHFLVACDNTNARERVSSAIHMVTCPKCLREYELRPKCQLCAEQGKIGVVHRLDVTDNSMFILVCRAHRPAARNREVEFMRKYPDFTTWQPLGVTP